MPDTHFCDDKVTISSIIFQKNASPRCLLCSKCRPNELGEGSCRPESLDCWQRRFLLISKSLLSLNFLVTHTGQAFPEGDFRMNRYLGGKKKALSARWAIDMIAEEPVIMSTQRRHMCDGTYGGLNQAVGHPRVWINLDDGEVHDCSYCGLRYQKK